MMLPVVAVLLAFLCSLFWSRESTTLGKFSSQAAIGCLQTDVAGEGLSRTSPRPLC